MLDLSEWQQWNYMAQGQKEKGKEPPGQFSKAAFFQRTLSSSRL
jgi:hypothetical protein